MYLIFQQFSSNKQIIFTDSSFFFQRWFNKYLFSFMILAWLYRNEVLPPGWWDELRTEHDDKSAHDKTKLVTTHSDWKSGAATQIQFLIRLYMTEVIKQASSKHRVHYKTKPIKCAYKTRAYFWSSSPHS